jgi:hypothetical protein
VPRKTFQALDVLLDSELNTYLMDQAVQTYPSESARNSALQTPTEGQITYINAKNEFQASHGGTAWYPVAGQMPFIEQIKTANQSFANASTTEVTWGVTVINRGDFTAANNKITIPTTGIYSINVAIYWAGNATGARLTKIMVSGTEKTRSLIAPGANLGNTATSSIEIYLTAGEEISVEAYQNSGGALNAQADLSRLTVRYVCP